jgi:hypothetical protein
MNTERAGWYVALITGVLALLTFLGLDKQSRAWVCRTTEGQYLCDKVQIDDVQVKVFALDYCYLHQEACPNGNTISATPLAVNPVLSQVQGDLRSIDNPDWENQPPNNLRFYVPSRMFPHGTGRKYLLYWELDFHATDLDHPVPVHIKPYLYLPPPVGSEGYYGDPYDKAYLDSNTVDFVLKPGTTQVSHLLTTASGPINRLEDVNDWLTGEYWIKFEVEGEHITLAPNLTAIGSTFTVYPYYEASTTQPAYQPDTSGNAYPGSGY